MRGGRRVRLSAEEAAAIEAGMLEGESWAEIGSRVGRHEFTILKYATRMGWREPRPGVPEETRMGVVAWYERGVRVADIQRRFKVPPSTLYRFLHEAKVPLRRRNGGV